MSIGGGLKRKSFFLSTVDGVAKMGEKFEEIVRSLNRDHFPRENNMTKHSFVFRAREESIRCLDNYLSVTVTDGSKLVMT